MVNEVLFFRLLGFLIILPLGISPSRVGLRLIISLIISSLIPSNVDQQFFANWWLEVGIGISLGIPLAIAPAAVSAWGNLFDTLRGQTIGSLIDPLTQSSQAIMGLTCDKLCWLVLLGCGAIELGISSVVNSYVSIPNAAALNIATLGTDIFKIVILELGTVFLNVMPVGLLFLGIEIGGGVVGKVIPKAGLLGEMFHLKTILGLIVLIGMLSNNQILDIGNEVISQITLTLKAGSNG